MARASFCICSVYYVSKNEPDREKNCGRRYILKFENVLKISAVFDPIFRTFSVIETSIFVVEHPDFFLCLRICSVYYVSKKEPDRAKTVGEDTL